MNVSYFHANYIFRPTQYYDVTIPLVLRSRLVLDLLEKMYFQNHRRLNQSRIITVTSADVYFSPF